MLDTRIEVLLDSKVVGFSSGASVTGDIRTLKKGVGRE